MTPDKNGKIRIPITKLEVGDFVEEVTKQLGDVKIVQTGIVRNYFALQALKKKGVIEVLVDTARSNKSEEVETTTAIKKIKIESQIEAALHWQDKALSLMEDTLARAKAHLPIDLFSLEKLAIDALALTKQHKDVLGLAVRCKMSNNLLASHLIRIAVSLAQFCQSHNYQPHVNQSLVLAGLLSRLGYQLLPNKLRLPNEKLAVIEQRQKQQHIAQLLKLLSLSGQPSPQVLRLLAEQNELLDGTGYPHQLDIDKLNSAQRILSIAITFDSLVFGFDHTKSLGSTAAFRELMDRSPAHFDPDLLQQFIQTVGLYPAGTLVKLASGRIALVIENQTQLTKPRVKVFYNGEFNHHVAVRIINLAESDDSIEGTAKAQRYDLNISDLVTEDGI
ncbi:HD-GYP domain-containing protein [Pseudoalteromonas sp. SSM20]|uniref:HD-GYP domain-containing protein n=1 Tax=Pseudoalteromonas sp. SSM20 TaxID=3139394 RepID=UPI003BAD3E28